MSKHYGYQSEGEKPSINAGWWLVILSVASLWLWKSLLPIMVMEIIFGLLWQIGLMAFLILVGYLLQRRRDKQPFRGSSLRKA